MALVTGRAGAQMPALKRSLFIAMGLNRTSAMKKLFILLMSPLLLLGGSNDEAWELLTGFAGRWKGDETGVAGHGIGMREYRLIMNDTYLVSMNTSTFQPQPQNPEGEVHEDWVVFSHDQSRGIVARGFYIEGFVIRYFLDSEPSNDSVLVFVSEAVENGPPGIRARLIYTMLGDNNFDETFEIAMPGKDFGLLLTNHWRRKRFLFW